MAQRSDPSFLAVPLGSLHLSPIIKSTDLPEDYNKSLSKLIKRIKSIIEDNENHHSKECEGFYIGMSITTQATL